MMDIKNKMFYFYVSDGNLSTETQTVLPTAVKISSKNNENKMFINCRIS